MKKCWKGFLIFASVMLLGAGSAYASGNVAGKIYSTDILAYVNDKPIDAYNIGGRTMVIVEDLGRYGYSYLYDDTTRVLDFYSNFSRGYYDIAEIPRGKVGSVLGDIYETDIKVFYNDIPITGYNIGGRTAVCIEDMGEAVGSPHEEDGYSQYLAKYTWDAENRTISLNSYISNQYEIMGADVSRVNYTFADNVFYANPDDMVSSAGLQVSVNGVPVGYDVEEAGSYWYTEEFGNKRYSVEPLYLDTNGTRTEIGTCIAVKDDGYDRVYPYINNPEEVKALAKTVRTPAKTYDEAMKFLEDNYTIKEKIDYKDYIIVKAADAENNIYVYSVKKTGGCLCIDKSGNHYDSVEIILNELEDRLYVHVYPFADSHGKPTTMMSPLYPEHYDYN